MNLPAYVLGTRGIKKRNNFLTSYIFGISVYHPPTHSFCTDTCKQDLFVSRNLRLSSHC